MYKAGALLRELVRSLL